MAPRALSAGSALAARAIALAARAATWATLARTDLRACARERGARREGACDAPAGRTGFDKEDRA